MALTPAKKADGLRYRQRNREAEAERSRTWRKNNKERLRQQLINWRLANPEKYRANEMRNNERKKLKRMLQPRRPRTVVTPDMWTNVGDLPVKQVWKTQEEWYNETTEPT